MADRTEGSPSTPPPNLARADQDPVQGLYIVDTDTAIIYKAEGPGLISSLTPVTALNGTAVSGRIDPVSGVATFTFQGDLILNQRESLFGIGSRPASLQVRSDVRFADDARVDFAAGRTLVMTTAGGYFAGSNAAAGPGGGAGEAGGRIVGTDVVASASSARVSVLGGAGGGTGDNSGGPGRFEIATNTGPSGTGSEGAFGGTVVGAQPGTSTTGPTGTNYYVFGRPLTPTIPGLVGGADAYGIVAGLSASSILGLTPPTGAAKGALILYDVAPLGLDALFPDFPGYDLLLFANLQPVDAGGYFGVGAANTFLSLLQHGLVNDPLFGGDGLPRIATLAPDEVFATLIPEGMKARIPPFPPEGRPVHRIRRSDRPRT